MPLALGYVLFALFSSLPGDAAAAPGSCPAVDTCDKGQSKAMSLIQTRGTRTKDSGSSNMKLVYGVFTSPKEKFAKQLEAVLDTWAKDVVNPHTLVVVGVNGSAPGVEYRSAPLCQDGHTRNSGISCKEATLLATGHELGADWVVVVGSDNYVFVKNFEKKLQQADANTPQILGLFGCGEGKFCDDHKPGVCGGGGYAISRAALDKMIGKAEEGASAAFVQEAMHTAVTVSGNFSDQVTSCMARRQGVKEVPTPGLYGWNFCEKGQFPVWCPFDKANYLERIVGKKVKPLTFHYLLPENMLVIHEMAKEVEASGAAAEDKKAVLQGATSLLEISADDDESYERQRAAYIQLVDKERSNSAQVEAAGSDAAQAAELHVDAAQSYEAQRAAYIEMIDRQRAAMLTDGSQVTTNE